MKKTIIALALLSVGCTKPKPVVPEQLDAFNCYIADSVVYNFRACGNSSKYDTTHNYYPVSARYITFVNVSKRYIDSVLNSVTCDTQICRLAWMFCEDNTPHDDMDTVRIFSKVFIK